MLPIETLAMSANQWQFLSAPDSYVNASIPSGRRLVLESTRRQFYTARDILTRLNGSHGGKAIRGVLLADDVGLGKTTVAALVAWVVASSGDTRRVRILAPNDVMMRRWADELESHVLPLQRCAPALKVESNRIKIGKVAKLRDGMIQVVKHSYAASDFNLSCDLLIVDEAHRAKGDKTAFSTALKKQKKHANRVLILTATPFSIRLDELQRMLNLIGGEDARGPVGVFKRALDDLYSGSTVRSCDLVADRLAVKAQAAVDALSSFVIRHSIEDLPNEEVSFGSSQDWPIEVPSASPEEIELMVRMDRMLRVAKHDGLKMSQATNDPRFHVGWQHFDHVSGNLEKDVSHIADSARAVVENQLKTIRRLRRDVGTHSKMKGVAETVKFTVEQGEKVLLFCHHHATAQELTAHLDSALLKLESAPWTQRVWRNAWQEVLGPTDGESRDERLRDTFLSWLSADLIRAQTWSWLTPTTTKMDLANELSRTKSRDSTGSETIVEAAQRLYRALIDSKSSRAVLKSAEDEPCRLPGAAGMSRVLGVCEPSENMPPMLFLHNQQPDTVISIFNSPFGPDVLVVTDKLSEGIDLHRYCRHLIHYELDPSPIRTVQRNGRLRRVNSWAAVTGKPIQYAYPAFGGTRDHRLVQIMKKRIDSFSLLLGGVQDFDVEEVVGSEEKWRNDVIKNAREKLHAAAGRLCAREPGER